MQEIRTPAQEALEDVFFGQVVIIWARWFIILAGAILVLWSPASVDELSVSILPVVGLMVVNFFMHGRYIMEQPANRPMLGVTSAFDLVIITLVVLFWGKQIGLESQFFVFYYPMIFAFTLVVRRHFAVIYTVAGLALYILVSLLAPDSTVLSSSAELEILAMRLVTIAAMGGLGTFYWRILRDRRRVAAASLSRAQELQTQLGSATPGE